MATHFLFSVRNSLLALFLGAVYYLHHGIHTDTKYFRYSWACWGLAILTRYTAVLFGPIALLLCGFALLGKKNRHEHWDRMMSKSFFLSPLIGFAILLPWLVRQHVSFGNALVGFRQASRQLQTYMVNVSMPWSYYFSNLPEMVTWVGIILLITGVLWVVLKKHPLGLSACLVIVFLFSWFSAYRYKEPRLLTSVLPFIATVGAIGLIGLWKTVLPKVPAKLLILAFLITFGSHTYREGRPWFDQYITLGYPVLNQASEHIRLNTDPDAVVMGSIGPQLAWYTNRRSIGIPGDQTKLHESLEKADIVMVVDFERGQPSHAGEMLRYFRTTDISAGRVFEFKNSQFKAYIFDAALLLDRMDEEARSQK
ncbi:MAG: glycosyltransferase family 39 protein [Bacteroidetes bacterium]|nr:glycosyltransferase family 39 protein [Bacteroidota bacterium]MDA1332933.1 glycosyltransferase family 39 protein [Bacteroidota bacterium]